MVAFNFDHVTEILRAMDVPDAERIVAGVRCGNLTEKMENHWSDGTLACWLKNNARLYANGPRPQSTDDVTTAILHVFPINYTETPEGLARIREDRTRLTSKVARSKVSTTNEVIQPVDCVARRVVSEDN